MKRRAPAAPVGVDKGIPQKVVKQALEIKKGRPYLIGKFHHVVFFNRSSLDATQVDPLPTLGLPDLCSSIC